MYTVDYPALVSGIRALTEDVPYLTANLANTSALCAIRLEDYQAAAQHLQAAIDANDDEEAVKEAKELLVQVQNVGNE